MERIPATAGHEIYGIHLAGSSRAHFGDQYISSGLTITESVPVGRSTFTGSYSYSSLRPVSTYVRRPDLERQLHDQLHPPNGIDGVHDMRTVVVWGFGGAGKSQLVLNYIQEHRQQYGPVFWIEAGQKETIERDYVQIYKQLFPNSGSVPIAAEDAIVGVRSWLQGQERRCLWVMDSADEIEDDTSGLYVDLLHYLPEAPQLDRIITTRSSRVQGISTQEAVAVAEMNEDEAMQLFQNCSKIEQTSEETESKVKTIVKELGCLALAIALAGSYVSERPRIRSDLSLYLGEYRTNRKRLLGQKARHYVHQYRDSVLSMWEMSFAAVERRNPIAARLLTLLVFINFNDIFLHLLRVPESSKLSHGLRNGNSEKMRWVSLISSNETEIDEYAIEAGFAMLQAYSFVSWQTDQESYSMHKLLHTLGHDRLDLEQRRKWSLAVLELLSDVMHTHEGDLATEIRLVPHVMANFIAISSIYGSAFRMPDRDRGHLNRVGMLLYRLGRWDDVYKVRIFLKQVTEVTLGPNHPHTLASINNLALVMSWQGKYEEAEKMHRHALVLVKELGHEHPSVLTSMNNLASVLNERGKYKEAEEMHQQTLELQKKVMGHEHPDTLTSMNNLALVLSRQGKYEEAEEMHRQALEMWKKVMGHEHPDTLTSMSNLASVLSDQGKYEEAEKMHRHTLELRKKVVGDEHPDTLRSMNNLAEVLSRQGKYEKAEEMHQQALDLRKKVVGHENPDTLTSMNNLASVLCQQGKNVEAEKIHRHTLELRKKVAGDEHPDTLTSMSNLASVLSRQGKYEEAEKIHRHTLELRKKMLGDKHPDTLMTLDYLARVLSLQGKYEEGEKIHRQTLELQKKVVGDEHPDTLTSMNNLGLVLSWQGKNEEAEKILRQTLELRKKMVGDEHPSTLTTINNLALVLTEQGKNEEAEKMHRQTLEPRKVVGHEHPDTLTSMNNLGLVLSL